MTIRIVLLCWFAFLAVQLAPAQLISFTGAPLLETFDSMGPAGLVTPTGWYVASNSATATNYTTAVAPSTGSTAPAGNIRGFNLGIAGAHAATDRALGTGPTGVNRYMEVRLRNDSGAPIDTLFITFDGEQWRTGSSTTVTNVLTVQCSLDGINYTDLLTEFTFVQPTFSPTSVALDGNAAANTIVGLGGRVTLPSVWGQLGTLYVRWFDFNDASTDPVLAIDNVSFVLPTNEPVQITGEPASVVVEERKPVALTVQATGYPLRYQWFKDGAAISNAVTATLAFSAIALSNSGNYTVVVSNSLNSVISEIATLTVKPDASYSLLRFTNVWRYNQSGIDLGTAWRGTNYDDAAWPSGPGMLGNESNPAVAPYIQTQLSLTNAAGTAQVITYYFRTHFTITSAVPVYLTFTNLIDDGVVIYVNGAEVYRFDMLPGAVNGATLAADDAVEGQFRTVKLFTTNAIAGDNVIAVEVHQNSATSSDVVFGTEVHARPITNGPPFVLEPPRDFTGSPGSNVTFASSVAGNSALHYQWRFNGRDISGATNATFTVTNISVLNDGFYSVRVTNELGSAISLPARLEVIRSSYAAVYTNNFEGAIGSEWSAGNTSVTPVGARRFLGEFHFQTITLTLTNLPPHTNLTVSFELFVIDTWDGNSTPPDSWQLTADGAPILSTTFAFPNDIAPDLRQSFPDPYPGGNYPGDTGASERGTLGHVWRAYIADAVYRVTYSVAHTNASVVLSFGDNDHDTGETWGLDNVSILASAASAQPWTRIVSQPMTQSLPAGATARFTVVAESPQPLVYQWLKNGAALNINATNATLTLSNITAADASVYSVVVSNAFGQLRSTPAQLTLRNPVRFDSATVTFANGVFAVNIRDVPPQRAIVIEASTNLTTWQPIATNGAGDFQFTQSATNAPLRFFRAKEQPLN